MRKLHVLWAIGAIVVLGGAFYAITASQQSPSHIVGDAVAACVKQGSLYKACLREKAREFVSRFGVATLLAAVADHESDPGVFSICHEFTHYIGQEAFASMHDVKKTVMSGAHVCYGGYYHGVMERFLSSENTPITAQTIPIIVKRACGSQSDYTQPILYDECLHGVGHGMMLVTEMDLSKALSFCDALPDSADVKQCYGGVFMENSTSTTNAGHQSRWVNADDPDYPCTVLDTRYKTACYAYQSTYVARQATDATGKTHWSTVIAFCDSIPQEYQHGCWFLIGTNQPSTGLDARSERDVCSMITTEEGRQTCIRGVATSLVGWHLPDVSLVLAFCSSVDDSQKSACYSQMGSSIEDWIKDKDEKMRLCSSVGQDRFVQVCIDGRNMHDL